MQVEKYASLYVYWSSVCMLCACAFTVVGSFFITAPYGRFSASNWGVLVPAKIAWFFMESPNLWVTLLILGVAHRNDIKLHSFANSTLLFCFILHYFNRSIIYPLRMHKPTPMPISVMLAAFFYCTWNGSTQAVSLIFVSSYDSSWTSTPQFKAGLVLFFIGFYLNNHSDSILLKMKQNIRKNPSNSKNGKYGIPRGGMFNYVSCPNFLGEIIEWWGFALACSSLPSLAFAVYTTGFLASRAVQSHKWYNEKFDDYPQNRKAVFPFLL